MRSVKAIYDGVKSELLEKVEVTKPCNVIVTFMDDETDIKSLRNYPADEDALDFWKVAEEDIYRDHAKEK